tara:strand:- start:962 stop:1372 length:411 start_codon:yes stop_codon:yes gene_type:complete
MVIARGANQVELTSIRGDNQLNLLSHPSYDKATKEERDLVCNGCGAAGAKFDFVPDTIWGLRISEACYRHDWRYSLGTTLEEKSHADWEFLQNLLTIIESAPGIFNKIMRIPRRNRAMVYYGAVRDMGDKAFFASK